MKSSRVEGVSNRNEYSVIEEQITHIKTLESCNKGRHPYPLCHAYRQMDDCGWVKHRADKRNKVAKLK